MPLIKDISVNAKKTQASSNNLAVQIAATATGSAGYFTSSIIENITRIYTGATTVLPIYITYTAEITNGTPPYNTTWTSSTGYYPPGYTSGTNTSSFTGTSYAYESDLWTVTVSDSSNPAKVATASIHSIIYAEDFALIVGKIDGNTVTGSDTQLFNPLIVPGGGDAPLKTISAALKYAVPDNTFIYVASGTYFENPIIDKKIYNIQSADGGGLASLGPDNYFIYSTKEYGTDSLRDTNIFNGPPWNFSSSSFNVIGVTTSGSIQSAIYDVQPSGTVQLLAGVHEVTNTISASVFYYGTPKIFRLNGVPVPTGSNDTYIYRPESIIRGATNIRLIGINPPAVSQTPYYPIYISNVALEIPADGATLYTGSFIFYGSNTQLEQVWRPVDLEMVRFRLITGSVPIEMHYNYTNTSFDYSDINIFYQTNPRRMNLRKYIYDRTNSAGAGSSTDVVHHNRNAPSFIIDGKTARNPSLVKYNVTSSNSIEAFHIRTGAGSFSGSRPSNSTFGRDENGTAWSTGTLLARRPQLGFTDSLYNGLQYTYFSGVTGTNINFAWSALDSVADLFGASTTNPSITGSNYISSFLVFEPTETGSASVPRRVIAKYGDQVNGFSCLITGSNFQMNVYATEPGNTSAIATMNVNNITMNKLYMAEFFLDGSSTSKRLGMALYDSSSMITSSYFSSTEFNRRDLGRIGTGSGFSNVAISVGASYYNYRTQDWIQTDFSVQDPFKGNFLAFKIYHSVNDVVAASNEFCRSIYNELRFKYFPTQSIVQRQITSDIIWNK